MIADRDLVHGEIGGRTPHQRDLDLRVSQRLQGLIAIADHETQIQFGALLDEGRDQAREEIFRGGNRANREPSSVALPDRFHQVEKIARRGFDGVGRFQRDLSRRVEAQARRGAVEQFQFEAAFQRLHARGKRGGRHAQHLGGGDQRALARDSPQGLELREGQISHEKALEKNAYEVNIIHFYRMQIACIS